MRIAWFTPFSRSSEVAAFSVAVAERLAAAGDDVTLWFPHDLLDPRGTTLPTVAFSPDLLPMQDLSEDVLPVYNIGSEPGLYGAVLAASRRVPGVVILHGASATQAWCDASPAPAFAACHDALREWYGEAVAEHAVHLAQVTPGHVLAPQFVVDHPLMAAAVQGARAVVVHARHQLDALQGQWGGFWAHIPYAVAPLPVPTRPPDVAGGRTSLLMLIRAHEVPLVQGVVTALAAAGLADRVELRVAGPLAGSSLEGRRLRWLLEDAGMQHAVRCHGDVAGAELAAMVRDADIHIHPRRPETDGMSPALLRALATARPVVAPYYGAAREVPDDAVARVDWDDPDGLARTLAELVDDAARRERIGAAGAAWAATHTFDAYATRIREVMGFVAQHPLAPALADRVGDHLRWLGAGDEQRMLVVVGNELERLSVPPELTADEAS